MRTKAARAVLGCVLAASMLVAACADSITAPQHSATVEQTEAQQGQLLGGLLGGLAQLLFAPLERDTPLPSNVTWTFTAGPSGAVSSNSAVGLSIYIPPNALKSTKTITVTALAGSPVAYRFEPHIAFTKDIYLTQNLGATSWGLLNLWVNGAHFVGASPTYTLGGLAIVDEIVGGLVLPWTQTVTIGVDHFSGWIFGSGHSKGRELSSDGQ